MHILNNYYFQQNMIIVNVNHVPPPLGNVDDASELWISFFLFKYTIQ